MDLPANQLASKEEPDDWDRTTWEEQRRLAQAVLSLKDYRIWLKRPDIWPLVKQYESSGPAKDTARGACYFCQRTDVPSGVYDFKEGRTGKRGSYRRRICDGCLPAQREKIRGRWTGR